MKEELEFYINENEIACVPLKMYNDSLEKIERLNNIIKKGINEELRKELDEILKCNQKQANRIYEEKEYYKSQLQQKENIIKEAREYIESYMPNYDFDKTNLIKLLEIFDKGE